MISTAGKTLPFASCARASTFVKKAGAPHLCGALGIGSIPRSGPVEAPSSAVEVLERIRGQCPGIWILLTVHGDLVWKMNMTFTPSIGFIQVMLGAGCLSLSWELSIKAARPRASRDGAM